MKTVEEFVDEMKRSEDLQDDARGIFAEFLLSQTEGELDDGSVEETAGGNFPTMHQDPLMKQRDIL